MIPRNYIIGLFLTCSILSCKPLYIIKPYDGPEVLEFTKLCELDQVKTGTMITTIAYYTGVEEYWGLTTNTKCELDHHVYLNTEKLYQQKLNTKLNRKLDNLYNNYWKYSFKMEITGRVDKSEQELGYGHLGLNKIQITPYQIRILGKEKIYTNE